MTGHMPTREQITEALKSVIDPELRRDIVELEMVRAIDIKDGGVVDVTVSLTTPGCPIKGHFQSAVAKHVGTVEGVTRVNEYKLYARGVGPVLALGISGGGGREELLRFRRARF